MLASFIAGGKMKTKAAWLREQQEHVWFAALANLIVMCTLLLIFRPTFETNDDVAIALFVNGARGTYDAHLVYSNYLLGLVLSGLYQFSNQIPWYSLAQYVVLFLSFTSIFHVIVCRLKSVSATWLAIIVTWIFAYEGYIRIQYTKTAGIASAAGILVLLYAVEQKKTERSRIFCGLGYLLSCTGFMYREQQFLAELALMSGVGVFLLTEGMEKKSGEIIRRLRRGIMIFGVLAIAIVCLHMADRYAYRSPQWQDYLEYNELRTELVDFGFPDYLENKAAYKELGINRTAFQLYRGWNYADTEKFTPEVMRSLIALKKQRAVDLQLLKGFFREVPGRLLQRISFCCLLLVLLYCLCCGRPAKSAVITRIYEILLGFALYLVLYYSGRYLFNRVDVGLFLAVLLVLLWTVPPEKNMVKAPIGCLFFGAVAVLSAISWKDSWRSKSAPALERMYNARSILEEVASDTEHLYVVKAGTISVSTGYGVFDTMPYGIARNIFTLGGWQAFTAAYCDLMREYGLTNPYRNLSENDKLYLIDRDIKSTMKYIHKYYDKSAQAVLISEYPSYNVYQITSG